MATVYVKTEKIPGSVKISCKGFDINRSFPAIRWPKNGLEVFENPTAEPMHRGGDDVCVQTITVYAVYDKSAAQLLNLLAGGLCLGDVVFADVVRSNDAEPQIRRLLTLSETYLSGTAWYYDERFRSHKDYLPGGIIGIKFRCVKIQTTHTEFDADLKAAGNVGAEFNSVKGTEGA
jgi:hypothetical protein